MESVTPAFDAASRLRIEMGGALAKFENALARPGGVPGWGADVARALVVLRTAFAAHVAEVEGDDGLLADLTREAPRVSNGVRLLEKDHLEIGLTLDDFALLLGKAEPIDVREHGLELMRRIVLHRQHGSDLVFEAYVAEIGGQS